jgi:hypothetical protein
MNAKSITNKLNLVSGGFIFRVLTLSRPENMGETRMTDITQYAIEQGWNTFLLAGQIYKKK